MVYLNIVVRDVLIFAALYLITAKFGLSLFAVSGFATLIWLPSGISLAALLIFGRKLWPGITLGAFLANYLTGAPPITAFTIGIGNTLEAVLAVYFLKNYFHFQNSLERLRDVLSLAIIAGFLSTMVSASIGVSSLWLSRTISLDSFSSTWVAWWVGDMISNLVVAPLILVYSAKRKLKFELSRLVEVGVIIILMFGIYLAVFKDLFGFSIKIRPSAYMVFPPLIWTALRFGQSGVVLMIFILSVLATLSTLDGTGPFVFSSTTDNLLSLQIFMAVMSVTVMILAAVVTERRKVEKTKDEFISIASHELKTPITTLKGYTQLLEQYLRKKKERKALAYIAKINVPVNNLTRLITDFFDVSKIQAGKLELQKEKFRIDDLVREVVGDTMHLTSKHKIIIIGKTKKEVLADKYRISQVLINLLTNAIKFSPRRNEIKVILSSDKRFVTISVQDFGIGILQKDIGKVFDRFFQADIRIRQSMAGMGLGLYISSEIVRRHGGKIWVKSEKGKGSIFSFTLPI